MTPSRNVALAVACAALSTLAAPAFAAEPSSHQKKLSALAADEAAFKRVQAAQGRQESPEMRVTRERQEEFNRLCRFKPVMTDPEIEGGCKRAYKL